MDTRRILALDIGAGCVKAWIADVNEAAIVVKGHGSVPTPWAEWGRLFEARRLSEKIKQAAECTKPMKDDKIDAVIVGLSAFQLGSSVARGSLAVKGAPLTRESLRRVREAAALTALPDSVRLLHTVAARYRLDGRACEAMAALGQEGAVLECECLAVGVSKASLAPVEAALEAAGIVPDAFVANVFAVYQAASLAEASYLLLDIGAASTDFALCLGGCPVWMGSLPIGGAIVTEDIARGADLDVDHAERLKRYFGKLDPALHGREIVLDCSDEGAPERNVPFDFLYDMIHQRVDEMAALVYAAIEPYLAENEIECLYVTGGGAGLEAFAAALADKFARPAQALDLQELPEAYRCPENAAGYGMLRYMQLRFARLYANQQEKEKTESDSFMHKLKKFMRL